jgi:hypothetical protein
MGLAVALLFLLPAPGASFADDLSGTGDQDRSVDSQPYASVKGGLQPLQDNLGGADQKTLSYVVSRMALESLSPVTGEMRKIEEPSQEPCTFSLSHDSADFGPRGGSDRVLIVTGDACGWNVAGGIPWLDRREQTKGVGPGTVYLSISPNLGPTPRTAAISVAGRVFSVTQSGVQETAQR